MLRPPGTGQAELILPQDFGAGPRWPGAKAAALGQGHGCAAQPRQSRSRGHMAPLYFLPSPPCPKSLPARKQRARVGVMPSCVKPPGNRKGLARVESRSGGLGECSSSSVPWVSRGALRPGPPTPTTHLSSALGSRTSPVSFVCTAMFKASLPRLPRVILQFGSQCLGLGESHSEHQVVPRFLPPFPSAALGSSSPPESGQMGCRVGRVCTGL